MEVDAVDEQTDFQKMPLDRRKSASTIAGDGDTCRICRGEGTLEQPLFYPCKCSGSIKYVHQDCLMEWLSHSQKKYCELCKTPFRFTKLYDTSMPATLPLPLFFRQVGVHAVKTVGRWLRYVFVTFIWTCWLPWSIRQIWRGLFWLADGSWMSPFELKQLSSTDVAGSRTILANHTTVLGTNTVPARATPITYFDPVGELFNLLTGAPLLRGLLRLITTKPVTIHVSTAGSNNTTPGLASLSPFARQPSLLSNVSSLKSLTKYQLVNNGLIDVLEGQLVCLSVIAAFILVFLIREWVINQQPIMNMPNPDRVDAQPAPAQPNEEARQQGGRRRRGFRRLPDNEALGDAIQRPIAIPRPRRAATLENIIAAQPSDQEFERPTVPPRSSSLAAEQTVSPDMFGTATDGETARITSFPLELQELESPPLQRGMFDEVVDIRRHIEERTSTVLQDDGNRMQDHAENRASQPLGQAPITSVSSDENIYSNQVQRMDFVPAQITTADPADYYFQDESASEPVLETVDNLADGSSDQGPTPEATDGFWTGSDDDDDVDHINIDLATPRVVDINDHNDSQDTPPAVEGLLPGDEDVELSAGENATPESLVGRVTQWMWHTDDHIREQAQSAEQADTDAANDDHEVEQPLRANNPHPVQAPAAVPAHEPNIQFGIDLNDPNALDDAEDLEGILELIGMEGPLAGMLQNIIFSVFLITLTLSASVWCPYIWGKIAILIMSNPIGVFVKAPLFFVSRCGNILVDMLLFAGGMVGYGLSNLAKLIKVVLLPALPGLASYIRVATVESWAFGISQNSGARLERVLSGTMFSLRPDLPTFSMQSHHALRVFRKAIVEASSAVSHDLTKTFKDASSSWHLHGLLGLPLFVFNELMSFPNAAMDASSRFNGWWSVLVNDLRMRPLSEMHENDIALTEWTTEDKILAILVGYAFFAAAGFAYLKVAHLVLGLKKDEKVDGVFADSLRQAGGVLKVIIIIGIEMIAFPLYCGMLLDCALLPLFKNATFQSRSSFLMNAPVTCLFIHWFVGTCYMFHFALFVSMCRKIMRKGVLYFIRDPDDPTFHPVRDVLERPVATQLGKIAFSALVYGGLVIVCLGGVVWTVSGINGILPVNWSTNEPRLAFPIDIVFYNFMLPFILRRAELSKKVSAMYGWWFRQCAKKLRLSHFLFGEEREDEKVKSRSLWQFLDTTQAGSYGTAEDKQEHNQTEMLHQDGRYVRVPAVDSVRIPKGTKVFVEVDEDNERIDGEPDRDTGMHGRKDERFTKIYIPSQFRTRVSVFVFLVWLFAASSGFAFTVVPLLVGRWLIKLAAASSSAPNDLYAYTVGVHVCGILGYVSYLGITEKDRLRSRAADVLTNTRESLPRLYRMLKYVGGLAYLFTLVFVVLPFATSLLTELYIHMPVYGYFANSISIALPHKPASVTANSIHISPTVFILQTWTLGLLYMRLALRLVVSYPNGQNRPSTALRAIVRDGYFHPDVALASRALVFPALTLCIVLLAAPIGLAKFIILFTGTTNSHDKLNFYRYSYPVLLAIAVSIYVAVGIQHKIEGWRIKVRDEVYLVGERLHNFTEKEGKKTRKHSVSKKVKIDKGKAIAVVAPNDDNPNDNIKEVMQAAAAAEDQDESVGDLHAVDTHDYGVSENDIPSGSSVM